MAPVECLDERTGRGLWQRAAAGADLVPPCCRYPSAWEPSRRCWTGSRRPLSRTIAPLLQQARHAPVNYIDETPWFCTSTLWLWVMASDAAAFYMIHPHRSKEAFAALIDDWAGILVSDGYGVYRHWVQARQTCLAHLIRSARGLAAREHPDLVACGTWAIAELQRLCHMATAPHGGEWRAWYARLCRLIDQYHDRQDDAGKLARRLLREMDSLWVFRTTASSRRTTGRSGPAVWGALARARWARPVTRATGG